MDKLLAIIKGEPLIRLVARLSSARKRRVFLVGGYLRDLILGRKKKTLDLDFAVDREAIELAAEIARTLKAGFVVLDQGHGCARVIIEAARRALAENVTLDFADFRGRDIIADLCHRDFTINSLAVDISNLAKARRAEELILNPCRGIQDLKRQLVRIGYAQSFNEDPLRILRTFSLAGLLGFSIEPRTLEAARKKARYLGRVAGERIRDELFKVFSLEDSFGILKLMDEAGVLGQVIPHLKQMRGVRQGPYHHLDVWQHSLETLRQLEAVIREREKDERLRRYLEEKLAAGRSRGQLLRFASLLHDIGKPQALKRREGKTIFHGHEALGRDFSREIASFLKLSNQEAQVLEKMVFWHLRPGYLADSKVITPRALFRYFRDTEGEGVSILLLSVADQRATCGPLADKRSRTHHERVVFSLIKEYFRRQEERPLPRLTDGHCIMKTFNLTPGPLIGRLLQEIEEAHATGEIKTPRQALTLAKKLLPGLKRRLKNVE